MLLRTTLLLPPPHPLLLLLQTVVTIDRQTVPMLSPRPPLPLLQMVLPLRQLLPPVPDTQACAGAMLHADRPCRNSGL
jgi:hypothetical protein